MRDCSKPISANPILVEDCERASDLLSSSHRGPLRRADDLLREIDELRSALQGEKDENKHLLREIDRVVRLSEYLLHAQNRWWREGVGSVLATAETTMRLLQQRPIPECPICREALCDGVTQCGHQFCCPCFDLWYQKQDAERAAHSCPICRTDLGKWNGKSFINIHGIR